MPDNYLIAEEHRRLLCEFTAALVPWAVPAGTKARDSDYDPLRLCPVASVNWCVDNLLGMATDIPMEWRYGEYLATNSTDLLTARATRSKSIGEALQVMREYQNVLTNVRTISHRSLSNGDLAEVNHGESLCDPVQRFLYHSFLASKLSHLLNFYSDSERQPRLDARSRDFGSLMRRLARDLGFVKIEYRDREAIFAFAREVLNHKLSDGDDRLRTALDREIRRKAAEVPVAGRWKERITYYIRSSHLSEVSLDEICNALRVHRRTLARLLKEEGTTFTKILAGVRRERAIHLVQATAMPLKRVASELGFNSDASFHMAFKSWTGATPAKFRKTAPMPVTVDAS